MTQLDEFVRGYIRAMLWAETDNSDESGGMPLEDNYGPGDITPDSMGRIRSDCAAFLERASGLINDGDYLRRINPKDGNVFNYAGHDFWLTRNHHGAGFWDGDWATGDELSEIAHTFPEVNVFVGDDGTLEVS
jgi:hypothetical protein